MVVGQAFYCPKVRPCPAWFGCGGKIARPAIAGSRRRNCSRLLRNPHQRDLIYEAVGENKIAILIILVDFMLPDTADVGRIFLQARARLADRQVLLGCARPAGMHKRVTDAYAVMAGLDGIAFPADGAVGVARAIGREWHQENACCSIKIGGKLGTGTALPARTCAA